MSCLLEGLLVLRDKSKMALGCKDSGLVNDILDNFDEEIQEVMEDLTNLFEEKVEQEGIILDIDRAIEDLVMGDFSPTRTTKCSFQHGYAFQFLCMAFGVKWLDNDQFSGMEKGWFFTDGFPDIVKLDSTSMKGIPLAPMEGEKQGDFPRMGYKSFDIACRDFKKKDEVLGSIEDEEIRETVEQYFDWLQEAKKRDCDLLTIYT
jgi:hypothetical protein